MWKKIKHDEIVLVEVLFIVMSVSFFWCVKKSGFFIDDIYTYGLSNSFYAPFVLDISSENSSKNKILTQKELIDYLTVSDDDAFRYDSVYYNQTQDTHPPLYYMMIHTISSVFRKSYSKWIGLSLNLILYFFSLLITYQIGKRILGSKRYASMAVLLYGLSYGGLSTVLMIRMYILMTFFTVCLTYFVIRLFQGDTCRWSYLVVCLLMFLGLFTQYFFVIFAFFCSAAYCIYEFFNKNFKNIIYYALSSFAGIMLFLISYPYVVNQFLADKFVSGHTVVENTQDISGVFLSIYSFIMQIAASYKSALLIILLACIISIIIHDRPINHYVLDFGRRDLSAIALAITTFLAIIVTAALAPVTALRYAYNILPIVAVVVLYFVKILMGEINNEANESVRKKFLKCGYVLLFLIICLYRGISVVPEYVENISKENTNILSHYEELPCVYVDRDGVAITGNLSRLIKFNEIYVTGDIAYDETIDYLNNRKDENIILYIDIIQNERRNGFNSEAVLTQIIHNTKYVGYKKLFSECFSETYLLYL